jgi:hypothetical protein
MSDTCLFHKAVKARKNHRCIHCGRRIRKGSKPFKDSGVYDGQFYSCYSHAVCYDAWLRIDDPDGEIIDQSEFRQFVLGLPLLKRNTHEQLRSSTD